MSTRRPLPNRRQHFLFDFEHGGIRYIAGIGRYPDGAMAEIFLDCEKRGSAAETAARDCAVLASLCLQHGVGVEVVRHALAKLADSSGAGPLGTALDLTVGAGK